jgi:cellulose synthase/poly-beta-1,6-N-acetylglucosamine synthase-like glycosyltransferase
MATKLIELELAEKLRPIKEMEGYAGVHILVRYGGKPLGWIYLNSLQEPSVSVELLRKSITEQMGWNLVPERLGEVVVPKPEDRMPLPPISVVVCTRDRANQLQRCLNALTAMDYPNYEIIVVDNAPANDLTFRLARQLGVRYAREDRPGLDWARNRGVAEASYDLIAYTDDDTRPDRLWLRAIAKAFAKPEVMAVTGLIAPMELETPAQIYFEYTYGGMSKGFRRWEVRKSGLKKKQVLWSCSFGAGANMAFRRQLFEAIGLFDVALDVGTPSRGGGDLEFFHRVVARGHTLVYEPAAMVWHLHRRDFAALRRQLYDNGSGFGAYLLTCWRNRTVRRRLLLRFAIREWFYGWILRRLWKPKGHDRSLIWAELRGALHSYRAYRAAQKHAKKVAASKATESAEKSAIKIPASNERYATPAVVAEPEASSVM